MPRFKVLLRETKNLKRQTIPRLYDGDGNPVRDFNRLIKSWLDCSERIVGRSRPAAFESLRLAYLEPLELLQAEKEMTRWAAHRTLLTKLTDLMFGVDIAKEISPRLTSEHINLKGFRSALAQGVAKNTGENFINTIVYALADALSFQDEVLVDKGLPPALRRALGVKRIFTASDGSIREFEIKIEADLCIYARSNPYNAIILSGKTRLKEVFHIAVMWKLLLDMLDDDYCKSKWGLERASDLPNEATTESVLYVFATADMISKEGKRTQGCDVERSQVRNLIAMDAGFMDYVFVSKSKEKAAHISNVLNIKNNREALFHELGCLLDLVEQKFALSVAPLAENPRTLTL